MVQQPSQDVLADLQSVITPVEVRPRPKEPAKPYNELITSKVYFSNAKWQECLSSHGIIVDVANKTLTIQSTATKQDFVYDLTEDEVKKLTNNSINQQSYSSIAVSHLMGVNHLFFHIIASHVVGIQSAGTCP